VSGQLNASAALPSRKQPPVAILFEAERRTDLDVMEKRKISFPYREWNSDSTVVQPLAYSLYDLWLFMLYYHWNSHFKREY
jgi:hypothetical protein